MPLDYEKRDGVAYITLNNPAKANILDKPTSDEISEAWIDLWEDRDIRCAIVTGTGDRHFCGGHNLAPLPDITEAERERRAVIIKAEGEVAAAENMAKAAGILSGSSGALHLRSLQTLNDLSSDQSNTVIFAVPLEVLRAFERLGVEVPNKSQNNGQQ